MKAQRTMLLLKCGPMIFRCRITRVANELDLLREMIGDSIDDEMDTAIAEVRTATLELVTWLEEQAASKIGPSGIGKNNYTWYQQNVHLLPLTWEDEVRLLQRELDRAWSSLKLEE